MKQSSTSLSIIKAPEELAYMCIRTSMVDIYVPTRMQLKLICNRCVNGLGFHICWPTYRVILVDGLYSGGGFFYRKSTDFSVMDTTDRLIGLCLFIPFRQLNQFQNLSFALVYLEMQRDFPSFDSTSSLLNAKKNFGYGHLLVSLCRSARMKSQPIYKWGFNCICVGKYSIIIIYDDLTYRNLHVGYNR